MFLFKPAEFAKQKVTHISHMSVQFFVFNNIQYSIRSSHRGRVATVRVEILETILTELFRQGVVGDETRNRFKKTSLLNRTRVIRKTNKFINTMSISHRFAYRHKVWH